MQQRQLSEITEQIKQASESSKNLAVIGNLNLDAHRANNPLYANRRLLADLTTATTSSSLVYLPTEYTWQSHGTFGDSPRRSCLDH
jgi:hypothetical protein